MWWWLVACRPSGPTTQAIPEPSSTTTPAPTSSPGSRLVAMLHGGGPEDDTLFGRFVEESGAGHVVTLGSAEPDDPNLHFFDGYFVSLGAAQGSTINTTDRSDALDPALAAVVDRADALFIRGGDQAAYLQEWSETPLHDAIRRAVARGVPVAGTSAGCALLGERIYDARVASVDAWQVLDDPFDPGLTFTDGWLELLPGVVTDTHLTERGRLPRLAVFVARWHEAGHPDPTGLGLDPETALFVYADGRSEVAGTGSVSVVRRAQAQALTPGAPLELRSAPLWQLPAGYVLELSAADPVRARPSWVTPPPPAPAPTPWPDVRLDGDRVADRALGDWWIPELDDPGYPWYHGDLTEAPGRSVLPGTILVTRLYDIAERFEAHTGGLLWSLARHPEAIGIGIDVGLSASTRDGALVVDRGWALVVDPRGASWAADPGAAPQTVALEGASLHVVPRGRTWRR